MMKSQPTTGAILHPGAYQGSVRIRQEQDRQALHYQQQSGEQPQSQSQGPSLGASTIATSNFSGHLDRLDRVARQPELAPRARRVYVGHADVESTALFGIQPAPTASEQPLLLKWPESRGKYLIEAKQIENPRGWSAAAIRPGTLGSQMVIDMIAQRAGGKMSYGQLNYRRTNNTLAAGQIQ
jgi:hypothetical protein